MTAIIYAAATAQQWRELIARLWTTVLPKDQLVLTEFREILLPWLAE